MYVGEGSLRAEAPPAKGGHVPGLRRLLPLICNPSICTRSASLTRAKAVFKANAFATINRIIASIALFTDRMRRVKPMAANGQEVLLLQWLGMRHKQNTEYKPCLIGRNRKGSIRETIFRFVPTKL